MNDVAVRQFMQLEQLEHELQQQKGMLWVLGEIMKVANNIDSFKQLMKLITDMLMGVTGVNTCYIWASDGEEIKVYLRSTQSNNEFLELGKETIHESLKDLQCTYCLNEEEITFPLVEGGIIPKSRLVVPLQDFNDNSLIGGLVLEQQQEGFFTQNNIIFFETLGIFIASNTKNSRLFEMVAEESERDPLTGVYNRRHLHKMLHNLVMQHEKLCVAVIDTDNFKSVNDFLGHIKGDEVLQAIASNAKRIFSDLGGKVIRYGGDEFVFLLPTNLKEGLDVFNKFQQLVPELPGISDLTIPVTITMGICAYPEMTKDIEVLVGAADNALLRGKSQGKNRVMMAIKEDCECKCVI
ncbi:MAG: sensor domain-containing diguanylate cyclase [Cellulosilyticaceae bacterium]